MLRAHIANEVFICKLFLNWVYLGAKWRFDIFILVTVQSFIFIFSIFIQIFTTHIRTTAANSYFISQIHFLTLTLFYTTHQKSVQSNYSLIIHRLIWGLLLLLFGVFYSHKFSRSPLYKLGAVVKWVSHEAQNKIIFFLHYNFFLCCFLDLFNTNSKSSFML